LLALLGLVLITSVAIAGAFMVSSFQEEEARARERLRVAEDVTREIVNRRNELLFSALSVLVEDFGFKSAIATRELPTMLSALQNQSQRFNSSLAFLADRSGRILANLHGLENETQLPFPDLLREAGKRGIANQLVTWESDAYQALMVPVQAPGLRAWLTMGFPLNDAFASALSQLTGVEVAFRGTGPLLAQTPLFGKSLEEERIQAFLQSQSPGGSGESMASSAGFFSRQFSFSENTDNSVSVVLLLDRQEALSNYHALALDLLLLVLVCFALATLLAFIMARALGRPVLELARYASTIGTDRETPPPRSQPRGELGVLQEALTAMPHQIRQREHRIRHVATHDALTGLPNRNAMDAYLETCLRNGENAFLVCFSIAGLKPISESLGFGIGDELVVVTALRIRSQFMPDTPVARSGGNEFMVLIRGDDRPSLHKKIASVRATCEQTTAIRETPINIQLVCGVLCLPKDGQSLDELRRRGNLTQERAVGSPEQMAFYTEGGDEHHLRELRIIRDLQSAMAEDQLYMQYQPQVSMAQATVVQVEALLRWQHPELGFINPEELIELAERSGQIHRLTDHILRCIERDGQTWRRLKQPDLGIAVNLSALDLSNPHLPELVDAIFADWKRPLTNLTFEITEGSILTDMQSALKTLAGLRDLGATLSVDDFGTGYSSLSQMRQLPVQELKIDKSFVLKLDSQPQDQLIVKSTLEMAHGLGLTVVAEGIENEASWHLLQAWGCELAQGYFIGRPMPLDKLADWLDNFRQRSQALAQSQNRSTSSSGV
jgi:diguanylate cyclase (GGDEF)-like protein